jgi:DNA invertase Pin-like site-specific DNA recombinase
MCKVVGYVRASTTEQEETIKAQVAKIEAYCTMRGLTLVHTYIDFGVSGTVALEEREQGAMMLQALSSRSKERPTGIVAVRLDRCFRNASDCLVNVEKWDKQGVALHLIDLGGQSIDTSSATGKFFITVMSGAAELERNLISERTSAVLQAKKTRGEVYNHTPLGYDRDGNTLTANQDEQNVIARIKAMREQGMSMWTIADTLNTEGVATKKGAKWYASTVKNALAA